MRHIPPESWFNKGFLNVWGLIVIKYRGIKPKDLPNQPEKQGFFLRKAYKEFWPLKFSERFKYYNLL